MPDIDALLAEAFGFELFEKDGKLQQEIDDTLERYADAALSEDELSDAAGGIDPGNPPRK